MTDELTEVKVSLGVLHSQMEGVSDSIRELREDIKKASQSNVTRNEWMQRNAEVDSKFASQGREISEIKGDLKSQRVPLTGIAAIVISALVLAWQVLGPIITQSGIR